jgi:hypothetical protein
MEYRPLLNWSYSRPLQKVNKENVEGRRGHDSRLDSAIVQSIGIALSHAVANLVSVSERMGT